MEDMKNYAYTLFRTIPYHHLIWSLHSSFSLLLEIDVTLPYIPFLAIYQCLERIKFWSSIIIGVNAF